MALLRNSFLQYVRCALPGLNVWAGKRINTVSMIRFMCHNTKGPDDPPFFSKFKDQNANVNADIRGKYKEFKDEDAPIIFDVEEERLLASIQQSTDSTEVGHESEFAEISMPRGVKGVFDIDDLVAILRQENAQEIVVIHIPDEYSYADQMVIVTAKSQKHMTALAEFIKRIYKKRRFPADKIPATEGKKSSAWLALDLGNIILHIFSKSARSTFDLESLWALGPEFDSQVNQPEDDLASIINKHSVYLGDLQPAEGRE